MYFFSLGQNFLSGTKMFCLGQKLFCPGQKLFCPGQKTFCPGQKIFCPGRWTGHKFSFLSYSTAFQMNISSGRIQEAIGNARTMDPETELINIGLFCRFLDNAVNR